MKTTICCFISSVLLFHLTLFAQSLPKGEDIISKVNARNEGAFVSQTFSLELIDRRGKKQYRETVSYRKDYKGERKTLLFFTSPTNVKGTGFLTFDYAAINREDDQWLYLPALRKTRRISAANRGDYFLGTDLTYDDIKKGSKISTEDFTFKSLRQTEWNGKTCYVVEATPLHDKVAKELGYSKVQYYIDPEVWIALKSDYWDIAGNPLKTVEIQELKQIDGIWTILKITAANHITAHTSILTFGNTDYKKELDDALFSEQTLLRGL